MRYTELKKQNKNLKLVIVILAGALAIALIKLHDYSLITLQQWNDGFNACIEENNLYYRYQ